MGVNVKYNMEFTLESFSVSNLSNLIRQYYAANAKTYPKVIIISMRRYNYLQSETIKLLLADMATCNSNTLSAPVIALISADIIVSAFMADDKVRMYAK